MAHVEMGHAVEVMGTHLQLMSPEVMTTQAQLMSPEAKLIAHVWCMA